MSCGEFNFSFIGEKYPVVLSIYGGPEVQLVSNTFKGIRQMRCHLLALQGEIYEKKT